MKSCLPLCLVLAVCSASCKRPAPTAAWSYDTHVGVVAVIADKSCLTTEAPALAPNQPLRIVDTGAQRTWLARVVGPDEACVRDAGGSRDRGYAIRADGEAPPSPAFGIAIVDSSPAVRSVDDAIAADLDGDGHPEFFKSCTSGEGVHFTIWSDRPLAGARRWHRYVALGYDVSPTCTPGEMDAP